MKAIANQLSTWALALLLSLAISCQPTAEESAPGLTLTNPSDLDRSSSPVVVPVQELTEKGMDPAQPWAPFRDGKALPYQYDDLDRDGQADELAFLVDLKAGAEAQVEFRPASEAPDFEPQTRLLLGKKGEDGSITPLTEADRMDNWTNQETQAAFQFEGVGWENEQVAFRNYLDMRNGMDIFGKTTQELLLHRVGLQGDDDYHHLLDWGMDVLKVGSSLGAGSVALWYQDSLVRLTALDADYRALTEGPVRSMFELNFRGVDLGDKKVDVRHLIGLYVDSYAYQAKVELSDVGGIEVVAGLVDLYDLPAQTLEEDGHLALYTYGLQSENQDSLGMALLVEQALAPSAVATDDLSGEIPDTHGLVMQAEGAGYHFYAAWEASSETFATEADFEAYLARELTLVGAPVGYTWTP